MPKYRVVTPKGASFTVAGGGYDYEKEALDPIDAEIIEAPANEAEFIAAAKTADAIYAKGMPITKAGHRRLENCKVITLGSVGVDSVDVKAATARGIPVTNSPRHLHRGGRRPRHDAAAGGFPPAGRAGQDGAHRPLDGGPAGAVEDPAADGPDARLHLVRPGGARGRQARAPFGLRMMAYDPFIQETLMYDHGVIPSTLNEVLSQSDFVSMHAPARPEVHHMLTRSISAR
jgi:D-3-phosphoglycerate dehydrogenase